MMLKYINNIEGDVLLNCAYAQSFSYRKSQRNVGPNTSNRVTCIEVYAIFGVDECSVYFFRGTCPLDADEDVVNSLLGIADTYLSNIKQFLSETDSRSTLNLRGNILHLDKNGHKIS